MKGNRSKMAIILRAITVLDKRALDVSTYVLLTAVPTNKLKRMPSFQGVKRELENFCDLP